MPIKKNKSYKKYLIIGVIIILIILMIIYFDTIQNMTEIVLYP